MIKIAFHAAAAAVLGIVMAGIVDLAIDRRAKAALTPLYTQSLTITIQGDSAGQIAERLEKWAFYTRHDIWPEVMPEWATVLSSGAGGAQTNCCSGGGP